MTALAVRFRIGLGRRWHTVTGGGGGVRIRLRAVRMVAAFDHVREGRKDNFD
jgi:hypothetical protein